MNMIKGRQHEFHGKRIVVTGAGSGIGRAAAIAFARAGASVMIFDLDADGLHETEDRISVLNSGRTVARTGDAGTDDAVQSLMDEAEAEFGGLDVIFANAGISGGWTPLMEQTFGLWTDVLRVNLIGPFLAIKHGAPLMMRSGGGSIVCTASVGGMRANAGTSPYAASKAGVISLVQTAAVAFTGQGIRVNAVCPGLIETAMMQDLFDKARAAGKEDRIGQLNPLKRHGQAEEVAELVLFLASEAASYVNGQAIAVDGGLSASLPFARHPQR
jgi:NAD(P)-dependent dehydrogenase (short-subunit alcohol dehydrogenase family)